jgi:hypothetical protein
MTNFSRTVLAVVCAAVVFAASATVAAAQIPEPANKPQSLITELTEPDYTLIDLPTTRPLKKGHGSFHLTHRFLGNLRDGNFSDNLSNVFGLDNGAMVGLDYRYAFSDRVQAEFYRTSVDKTIQFSARADAVRQTDAVPVSISVIGAVEGNQNFGWHAQGRPTWKTPSIAAVVSRTLGEFAAVYVVPTFVHNTLVSGDTNRDTFMLGTGARLRVRETVYLVGEVTPRLSGYAPGKPEFGFGIEKRAGGHMFQLNFTNTTSTTFGQVARGGFPTTLYLGFNLGRKF